MIAPTIIGDAALAARLAAIPAGLRAALAGEADRLGRMLRDRAVRSAAGGSLSIAVESTAAGVMLTMARRSDPAGNPGLRPGRRPGPAAPRSRLSAPTSGALAEPPGLRAAFAAAGPEIRSRLAAAFRGVLIQ